MSLLAALLPIFMATGTSAADLQQASIMSVKIAVADFRKSTDFYVRYLGMKQGTLYNETEQGVDWPAPGQGSNLILVHDPSETVKLTPGTAWIVFKVPDARKTAKDMTNAGVEGVSKPMETDFQGHRAVVVVARDPDGNQIEMLQVGATQ